MDINSMWKQIFKTVLIAGSLNISAASLQAYFTNGVSPDWLLKFIAGGWFGKEVFAGGAEYLLFGLLVHFFIVFAFITTYIVVYPKIKIAQKNIWFSALLIALIAWTVTARLIIPFSQITPSPFNLSRAIVAILILFFCIGPPIAFLLPNIIKSD